MKPIKSNAHEKVVLITGASSGIGRATARAFAKNGWQVVATMRSPEKETELKLLSNVTVAQLDVTDTVSIERMVKGIEASGGRVDVLVNNAGYGLMGPFEGTSAEQIERQFATNVFGLMNVTRAILPLMRRQQSGRIINISSIGGRVGIPLYSSYHATKFAVEGFTESLNFEINPLGIDAVLIEPGAIATEFLGRSADLVVNASDSPYHSYFNRILGAFEKASKGGASPDRVAKRIVKVASKAKPSLRNPIGGGAEALMALRKILPDCAVKSLVKQQTGG